jgi:hypothetical protein
MLFVGKWTELEITIVREITQAQKDKHRIYFSYVESRFCLKRHEYKRYCLRRAREPREKGRED